MANAPVPTTVTVPVKSAWLSKINWVQIAPVIAGGLTWLGVPGVTPEMVLAIYAGVSAVVQVVTPILRTFYNGTVNPSSLPPGSTA